MKFEDFEQLVKTCPDGVVLLEGRRAIPDAEAGKATDLAIRLAQEFPTLQFRSGNAKGSDEAFSKGILQVDPSRLQVVVPYAAHRKRERHPDSLCASPDSLTAEQENEIVKKSIEASPKNRGMLEKRAKSKALGAKAAYLIRDTMKVTGFSDQFQKPICGLFYVDSNDPYTGGTGHTVKVCDLEGVPSVFQKDWLTW